MKLKSILLAIFVAVFAALPAFSAVAENEKLGDVMYLLSDAAGGLMQLSKLAPGAVEAKDFGRSYHRCGGASFLLDLINEKKGTVVDGKLVVGELTPGMFLTVEGEELQAMVGKFSDALNKVKGIFEKIEAELKAQAAKAPNERNFKAFKLLLADLDSAIKASHQDFKPPQKQG